MTFLMHLIKQTGKVLAGTNTSDNIPTSFDNIKTNFCYEQKLFHL